MLLLGYDLVWVCVNVLTQDGSQFHHCFGLVDGAYVITVFWVDKKFVALYLLLVAAMLKVWPDGQLYSHIECEQIVQLHQADRNTPTLQVGLITDEISAFSF